MDNIIEEKILNKDNKEIGCYTLEPQLLCGQALFIEIEANTFSFIKHLRYGTEVILQIIDNTTTNVINKLSGEVIGYLNTNIVKDYYSKGFVLYDAYIHGCDTEKPWLWASLI